MLIKPVKSALANNGPLVLIDPWIKSGYFSFIHAANDPGYDPPKAIHLVFSSQLCFLFLALMNEAKSANACRDDKYFKFSTDKSLESNRGRLIDKIRPN